MINNDVLKKSVLLLADFYEIRSHLIFFIIISVFNFVKVEGKSREFGQISYTRKFSFYSYLKVDN
jgi:hypothetical protein